MSKETVEEKWKVLQKSAATPVSLKQESSAHKFFSFFSIAELNRILWIATAVCAVILIVELYWGFFLLNKKMDFSEEVKTSSHQQETNLPQVKDVKYYIDSLGNRNIFKPYDIELGKAAVGEPNLARLLSKYKLVGVAWLDLPESASIMVEDTRTKATHFLKTGEQLEGVTVKTIYTDRVVFSYENEEITIKL
ncbi:MAG: hypothetical protein HY209_05320 [Candidatus Omnitrophica bacterium]|nr:hypothetical protein [Candidatus Omnitrophota bacterium]